MLRYTFILPVFFIAYSCSDDTDQAASEIEAIVLRHTGLDLSSFDYELTEDEITHEDFSLNYRRENVLVFDSASFEELVTTIESTPYFNQIGIANSWDWDMWDTVATEAKSGLWCTNLQGYTFLFRNDGKHSWAPNESLVILVKTANRSITTTFYDKTRQDF